jgi:hypothetical protein
MLKLASRGDANPLIVFIGRRVAKAIDVSLIKKII